MKARIRGTNVEVEVYPLCDETGYFAGFQDGFKCYRVADLVFPDTPDWDRTDWESFRKEAAKDILCAMIHHQNSTNSIEISIAINIADELIKQLKEE